MLNICAIFDSPCPDPIPEHPFHPFADNWLSGPVPAHWAEETATDLTCRLARVTQEEATKLVSFGALWLDDRPCLEPYRTLGKYSTFRINPPIYGPCKFYEADPQRVVFEDSDLIIYNKESGRPSQGVPHDAYNNVLSGVGRFLQRHKDLRYYDKSTPPLWLLHRLDADTSGLLMMAKNKVAAGAMGRAFQEGKVEKEYLCLGLGAEPQENDFSVHASIAKEGRRYITTLTGAGLAAKTLFSWKGLDSSLKTNGFERHIFKAQPLTGRTHQIRLHLAHAGWPISGDRFYGRPNEEPLAKRLMLAAVSLTFNHPRTGIKTTVSLPGKD